MKKILILLITILLLYGGIFIFLYIRNYNQYETYKPINNNIDNKYFVDNQIIIQFYEDVSFKEIKDFTMEINGKIDNQEDNKFNFYVITLDKKFESINEINKYCDAIIKKYNIIESCASNNIIYLDDPISDEKIIY